MSEITEKFHIKTNNKFEYVKIWSIVVNKDTKKTVVTLLHDKKYSLEYKNNRSEILGGVKSLLPPTAYPKFEETVVDCSADGVWNAIFTYLKNNNFFLLYAIKREMAVIITGDAVNVKLNLPESVYEYALRFNFQSKIIEYLNDYFFTECAVTIEKVDEDMEEVQKALDVKVHTPKFRYAREDEGRINKPTEREKYLGEVITDELPYICDCIYPKTYLSICGTISDCRLREYTKKVSDKEEKRKMLSFTIADNTGSMQCVYFAKPADIHKIESIKDGDYFIVSGKSDYDDYNGTDNLRMMVRRMSLATQEKNFEINEILRLPNDDYLYVKPQDVVFAEQISIMGEQNENLVTVPIVLFELRTSALSGKGGVLIEIGAVKIVGGRIVQSFSSLINPEIKLSDKLIGELGIDSSNYLRAPNYEQVLIDFYLFTEGCDITAYPSAENFAVLQAAYKKLHIPCDKLMEYSDYINLEKVKSVKIADKTALAHATAYAKKLII